MTAEHLAPDTATETMLLALEDPEEFEGGLARLLQIAQAENGEARPGLPPNRHRRQQPRRSLASFRRRRPPGAEWWLRLANLTLAAGAAVLVAMLSVLGGVISYAPLRGVASPNIAGALAAWWPLLIYGPWLVASLSILRAALHQRQVLHSWVVLVCFSGLAVALCVADAPRTLTALAVTGLPPLSALAAFHQLVRQIALLNPPRHAIPHPRHRPRPAPGSPPRPRL